MENIKQIMQENEAALHAFRVFMRASTTINRHEGRVIKQHQLTLSQFAVMEVLYNKGNMRIQDLIEKLQATSGNITVIIRNMIRDGYIFKTCHPSDKRAFLIGLTPLGRETIERVLPEHYANIGQIFSVLTEEEQNQLANMMKKFKNL